MLQEKRVRRPPTEFIPDTRPTPKKAKPLEKKIKLDTCKYQLISLPPRYDNVTDTLLLSGSIPLVQKDNSFFTDFSLLNKYHIFANIEVTDFEQQKIVHILTERREDVGFSRWKTIVKKTSKSKVSNLRIWSRTIRDFSESYERIIKKLTERPIKTVNFMNEREEIFEIIDKNKTKRDALMSKYPCIQLKAHFRGFENHLVEIVVNEAFLKMTGYATETFVSSVLNDGFPNVIPFHVKFNTNFIKNILEHFAIERDFDFSTPEFDTQVLTKSGFVKSTKAQVHFLANYEDGRFGSDTLFTFTDQELLYLVSKANYGLNISPNFIDMMVKREEESHPFFLKYYDYLPLYKYSNLHKTCTIKEIVSTDNELIKNEALFC